MTLRLWASGAEVMSWCSLSVLRLENVLNEELQSEFDDKPVKLDTVGVYG